MNLIELIEWAKNNNWTQIQKRNPTDYDAWHNANKTVFLTKERIGFQCESDKIYLDMPNIVWAEKSNFQIDEENGLIIIDGLCALKYK